MLGVIIAAYEVYATLACAAELYQGDFMAGFSLRDSAGRIYGPWKVSTSGGSGGKNVNWMCNPNAILPAGTYTVIDSDNATWSQNPGSAGRGFVRVTAISQ